jgi:inhibitor of KinA
MPLGDRAFLVRFADRLDMEANAAAIAFARDIEATGLDGVLEIAPNLVSVLVRYDPQRIGYRALCGEIGLVGQTGESREMPATHILAISYGGEDGPDIGAVADSLGLDVPAFIAMHSAEPLRVLSVGFAPGFVYCGMHPEQLSVPRRETVRASVPAGSVLFAARQTAIAATPIPTGWPVIGRTRFINFDVDAMPPTRIRAGDNVVFEATS